MTYIGNFLLLFIIWSAPLSAQTNDQLIDGRTTDPFCIQYQKLFESKPKEILLGIHIRENGDVYFIMDNESWFQKLFTPGMGITTDFVTNDQYDCDHFTPRLGLFRGTVLPPLRYEDFKSHNVSLVNGVITLKIGTIPPELQKKQLEGNLVIVNQNKVCYYMQFIDIPRAGLDLLPMGFYMDMLTNLSEQDTITLRRFSYQRSTQIIVPFEKNKDTYEQTYVQRIIDSLQLTSCIIKKVDIRAYTSVEGNEAINRSLMKGRAGAMVAVLKKMQPDLKRITILTAENWIEFYRDILLTPFKDLSGIPRPVIKLKLLDPSLADSLEPTLAKERKAVLTIYYEQKHGTPVPKETLASSFQKAIADKKIDWARNIQRQVFDLINDSKLPETYLDKLEVPRQRTYWELINDQIIFKYQIFLSDQDEAAKAFEELRKLDPNNGKINYNLCTFALLNWQFSDSVDQPRLLADINRLEQQGINYTLIKRLLVNYHILQSQYLLNNGRYDEKDKSVQFIKDSYRFLPLTDKDRFSLAKYFTFYSQQRWAKDLIIGRVDQLNVSEDLVFYYVNLGFYDPANSRDDKFTKALINCFTINRPRFCKFFNSTDKGGASMQLLEQDRFRQLYCEKCRQSN
ncbi:MAG: hypothetical protein JST68_24225 [Bacteroidetes bacterium]|nr:hypothetical protein [Bacteroidota bacterium]